MTTLPPSMAADCRPSMVTSGSSALRATWREHDAPARQAARAAASTKSMRQTSAMPARIMRR